MFRILIISLVLVVSGSGYAWAYDADSFATFKLNLQQEAIAKGLSPAIVKEAMDSVQYLPKVIELDRKQPEKKITFAEYKNNILTDARINKGREMFKEHRAELERVSKQYGVQPEYIVALWGMETNYGGYKGNWGVMSALATLAYEGRRAEFFKKELMNAMRILDEGHIELSGLRGSWAGALGHNQFMPSSFLELAVDGDKDGRKDIWNDLNDVFPSSANYLAQKGWNDAYGWGYEVTLPAGFPESLLTREIKKPVSEWLKMGVVPIGGKQSNSRIQASIVAPDGIDGAAYLVYSNYDVIMKWNRSLYFATTVGLLADAVRQ
ncbi:MAG: lytic transglycosylase [Micavibrio sp.]|nr:lytic transglycosylase [Micavibrio sp.]